MVYPISVDCMHGLLDWLKFYILLRYSYLLILANLTLRMLNMRV